MMTVVKTAQAPQAIGPYSQAVQVGEWLMLSGQIGLLPESGLLVEGDISQQTEQVMKNIGAVLAAAGLGYEHLVKTTLYLVDLADFAAVNAVYARYVQPPYPARATLGVVALPKGARVEIEAMARFVAGGMD